jgi:hypothetical protein
MRSDYIPVPKTLSSLSSTDRFEISSAISPRLLVSKFEGESGSDFFFRLVGDWGLVGG